MRLTKSLFRQHIGWHFEKYWHERGKRKIINMKTEAVLKSKGIKVFKPEELLQEKREFKKVEVIGYGNKHVAYDETHPNYHVRRLLTYNDNNILLEGLQQAKALTKTVQLKEGLPESVCLNDLSKEINRYCKKIILNSHVFDAEQKKLPKIKDPERPAFNLPRVYGITQERNYKLLISKLLHLIETTSDYNIVKDRFIFNQLYFSYPFETFGDLIQFRSTTDTVITSTNPLNPIVSENTENYDLPDLFPLKPTVSLTEENIYVIEDIFPLKQNNVKNHPHTIIINYNKEFVKNLYEEPVTDTQIFGRSLMKAFTVAATYARQLYGNEVTKIPKPVTLQCIQTDGRLFHFGVLQLNTLDLNQPTGIKNVWYQTDLLPLFEKCCYEQGKPILEGYNSEIIKHLYSFYNNV